jgi:hypothetical protein
MKSKPEAAIQIIKMLDLYNNSAVTEGEKAACKSRIIVLCEKYNFKIKNSNELIDLDDTTEYTTKLQESYNPYKTNMYVWYKGKKWYNGVPKSEYIKEQIGWQNENPASYQHSSTREFLNSTLRGTNY